MDTQSPKEHSTAGKKNVISWTLHGFQDLAECHQLKMLLGDKAFL